MEKVIESYKWFFSDQLRQTEVELKSLVSTSVAQLVNSGDVNLGYIESVIPNKGRVVFKFPKAYAPRLKVLKSFVIIKKAAFQEFGTHPKDWKCTLGDFKGSPTYHTIGSDLFPLYFIPSNDGYVYIECTSISLKMYSLIANALSEGKHLSVLINDPFPPIDYLLNLRNYMQEYEDNKELLLEPKMKYEDWHPEELRFNEERPNEIADVIYDTLDKDNYCILQGPPGTGKSYVIASIVARYLENNKTVCATTMANKGLLELILQKPLKEALAKGAIFKTNLSIDEAEKAKGLQPADKKLIVSKGNLICATNYVLSGVFKKRREDDESETYDKPYYDLVVIEEASQAFLTAIAAFKSLGTKCLIVGDPMQLPPIVKSLKNPQYKLFNASAQIEGMTTYALGSDIKAYRITTSHRLTPQSVQLTALFYNNRLTSVNREKPDFSKIKDPHILPEGGVIYEVTNDNRNSLCSESAISIIGSILEKFKLHYPETEVAIIAPFQDTVKELQRHFSTVNSLRNLTVETVDRIQGMTVDYAILYLPGWKFSFALEKRRFNVATSRSRTTTLILSDISLEEMHSIPETVIPFISKCAKIVDGVVSVPYDSTTSPDVQPTLDNKELPKESIPNIQGVKVIGKMDLSKFERKKVEIKEGKKNYYVIDTNVFVNCPDIISKIDSQYPVILSAKVIDELDKLKIKLDEAGKINVQKALKSINLNMDKKDVRMELADVSLLPDDFNKKSPDNMILTVALKFKDDNPILLTSDNGLQVKAKGLGITTISLKTFLKK